MTGCVPPLLAAALATALALLGPLAGASLDYDRARWTIWASFALAAPALVLWILACGRRPLGRTWRLWWSAGLAGYGLHLWQGFGVMLAGDWSAAVTLQGDMVAGANALLAVLWAASAGAAWAGRPARWLHGAATVLLIVAALTSTITFGRPPSPAIGWTLAALLAAALVVRLVQACPRNAKG